MLTVKELPKRGKYMLSLTVAASTVEGFTGVMPQLKSAVAEWRTRREGKCDSVLLGILAEPWREAALRSALDDMYQRELAPIVVGLTVVVTFANEGQTFRQYFLGGTGQAGSTPKKRWWKVW